MEDKYDGESPLEKRLDVPCDTEYLMFQPEIPSPVLKTDSRFPEKLETGFWNRYAETCACRPPLPHPPLSPKESLAQAIHFTSFLMASYTNLKNQK